MSAPGFDPAIAGAASEAQRQAADPRWCVFVEANAGSGKTRVLVDRVARLLLQGAAPDRILCVTFTKAAAGEMQARLFRKLGDWSTLDDEALGGALERLGVASPSQGDLADARRLFARALETPGGLKIQTLHSYCETLLRRFPVEAGLSPGFETQEDAEAAATAARALEAVLSEAVSEPQGEVARAIASVLELVGPSGVDTLASFAARERHALERALEAAGSVEALQDKASAALGADPRLDVEEARADAWSGVPLSRLRDCIGPLLSGSQKSDAPRGRALRRVIELEREPGAALDAYLDFVTTLAGALKAPRSFYTRAVAKAHPDIEALFGPEGEERRRLDDHVLPLLALAEANMLTRAGVRLAGAFLKAYRARLSAARKADFADLVEGARALLSDSAARDWVLYKLDQGLEHILVDEAQDTAPAQWDVINALSEEFFAGEGGRESDHPRTVFCVGDEKQSIYSFQGARPARFIAEGDALAGKASDVGFARPLLSVSFRSAPEVLDAVDRVFAAETDSLRAPETKFQHPEGAPTDSAADPESDAPDTDGAAPFTRYQSHAAARVGTPGCVEVWSEAPKPVEEDVEPLALDLDTDRPDSARNQLAEAVAREIAELIARGDAVWEETQDGWVKRPARAGDVIVLVRRRAGLFEEIIRRLKLKGVPVAGADRMTLGDQLVVKDLIALARFALLPEDDLSLAEILKSPAFHPVGAQPVIDDDALFDLTRRDGPRLWDKLRHADDPRFAEARDALEAARARVDVAAPYGFFASFLNEAGATGESRLSRIHARLGREAHDPLEEFLSRALAHERDGAPSLARFVAAMEADASDVKREMEAGRDEVRVMTVHGAKGLEAPIVFLPDTAQRPKSKSAGLFAHDEGGLLWAPGASAEAVAALKTAAEAEQTAEYGRLLYVGLTRARDRLVVCGHAGGRGAGGIDEGSWLDRVKARWTGEDWRPVRTALHTVAEANGWSDECEVLRLGPDPDALSSGSHETPASTPEPAWMRLPAPEEPPAARAVAPSKLIADEAGSGFEPASLSPLSEGGEARFRRGSLIHKLLQTLPDLAPERRAESAARFLAAQAELDDAEREEIAAETLRVIEDERFAALFAPGSRAEAAIAGTAPELPAGMVVNGQIDRLVVTKGEVLVVDYKTNRPPPERVEDVAPSYLAQMAAYRALLKAAYPGRAVRCALLWTDAPRLMALPDATLAAVLDRTRS